MIMELNPRIKTMRSEVLVRHKSAPDVDELTY